MPIRINLLAEAQAAEEMRLRDPVKRAIWIGGFLVCVVGIWVAKLQMDIFFEQVGAKRLESRWTSIEPRFKEVTTNQNKILLVQQRLEQLDRLSTNRFFWGSLLNALQQTVVDNVQVTRIRGDQTYVITEEVPAKSLNGKTTPRQPASSLEKIRLTIEAKDWNFAEQTYNSYKETLSSSEYFTRLAGRDSFILGNALSAPAADPQDPSGRQFVSFTLNCSFPEVRRDE